MWEIHEPPAFGNYMVKDVVHIVLPPQIDWSLSQPGFLVTYLLLFFALTWWGKHFYSRWKRNAYRRHALLRVQVANEDVDTLLGILRETAMVAYPDQGVETLSGDSWWNFLNSCCVSPPFSPQLSGELELRYRKKIPPQPELAPAITRWIREHQEKRDA